MDDSTERETSPTVKVIIDDTPDERGNVMAAAVLEDESVQHVLVALPFNAN